MNNFIYSFEGFYPGDSKLGSWGFEAYLDPLVAFKIRDISLDKIKNIEELREEGRLLVKKFELDWGEGIKPPYMFVGNSFLIQGIRVPGNSCDLSLRQRDYTDFVDNWEGFKKESLPSRITYFPHNVDNRLQQHCLFSLWINWANMAQAILS